MAGVTSHRLGDCEPVQVPSSTGCPARDGSDCCSLTVPWTADFSEGSCKCRYLKKLVGLGCITFVYFSRRSLAKDLIQQMFLQLITEGISLLLKHLVNHKIGTNFIMRTTK